KLDKNTFAPGEGSEILVKFNFGAHRGPTRKMITVTTQDKQEYSLDLRVWIQEPLTIAPSLVFWKVGDSADAKSVELTIAAGQNLKITGSTSTNPRIGAKLEILKAGEKYSVKVKPEDTTQKETAEVSIHTDYPSESP